MTPREQNKNRTGKESRLSTIKIVFSNTYSDKESERNELAHFQHYTEAAYRGHCVGILPRLIFELVATCMMDNRSLKQIMGSKSCRLNL